MITVKNTSGAPIEVSINRWGTGGSTEFFTIQDGKDENWDRTDDRGFVMSVNKSGTTTPYYVLYNSNIDITKGTVKDLTYNVNLKPANSSYTTAKVES